MWSLQVEKSGAVVQKGDVTEIHKGLVDAPRGRPVVRVLLIRVIICDLDPYAMCPSRVFS